MKQEHITLRCDDGAEAAVFTKYTVDHVHKEPVKFNNLFGGIFG